jgi:hypothetical protein
VWKSPTTGDPDVVKDYAMEDTHSRPSKTCDGNEQYPGTRGF